MKNKIKVEVEVKTTINQAWKVWNDPLHITKWYSGHPDWHTPRATNDLRVGGKIHMRMEAKDGSMGFDFINTYTEIIENQLIKYQMDDGRECETTFKGSNDYVKVVQIFDPESENTLEQQKEGWQNILNNFQSHIERFLNI